jgi:hypothetical protein
MKNNKDIKKKEKNEKQIEISPKTDRLKELAKKNNEKIKKDFFGKF